jgi:CelD/BcsL family acetyltransferase involved in cellulose biosynthesis
MYSIKCHSSYDFNNAAFKALYERSKPSVFQNPLWLGLITARLASSLYIVTVIHEAQLIALYPFVLSKKHGVSPLELLDCGVSDYNDFIIDKAHKIDFESVIKTLPKADVIWISKVDSLSHSLPANFQDFDMRFGAHRLPMGEDFNAWREATYDPTMRRSLEKKTGKLSRKGVFLLEELQDAARITENFKVLANFRAKRFAGISNDDLTQVPKFYDFYLDYAIKGAGTFARTYLLSLDGVPIAVSMGLNGEKSHHIVLLSYDSVGFANWSPGLVMIDQITAEMHKRGERLLDLTIGDEPYKFLFGVTSTKMIAKVLPLTLKGKIYFMLYKFGSKVKQRLLKKR